MICGEDIKQACTDHIGIKKRRNQCRLLEVEWLEACAPTRSNSLTTITSDSLRSTSKNCSMPARLTSRRPWTSGVGCSRMDQSYGKGLVEKPSSLRTHHFNSSGRNEPIFFRRSRSCFCEETHCKLRGTSARRTFTTITTLAVK